MLPDAIRKRIVIEATATAYWYRFVGLDGVVLGIDQFGLSAPENEIYKNMGLTIETIINTLRTLLLTK